MPHHLAKKLVELLYFRETNVLPDEKVMFMNAIKLLKISGVLDDDGIDKPAKGMCLATVLAIISNIRNIVLATNDSLQKKCPI